MKLARQTAQTQTLFEALRLGIRTAPALTSQDDLAKHLVTWVDDLLHRHLVEVMIGHPESRAALELYIRATGKCASDAKVTNSSSGSNEGKEKGGNHGKD